MRISDWSSDVCSSDLVFSGQNPQRCVGICHRGRHQRYSAQSDCTRYGLQTMSMNAFITGASDTEVGELPGSTCMGLHAQAALAAVQDAGLQLGDIDGVLCAYSFTAPHLMLASVFCEYMGLHPSLSFALQAGWARRFVVVMKRT